MSAAIAHEASVTPDSGANIVPINQEALDEARKIQNKMLAVKRGLLGEGAELSDKDIELANKLAGLSGFEAIEEYEKWRNDVERDIENSEVIRITRARLNELLESEEQLDIDALTGAKSLRYLNRELDKKVAQIDRIREGSQREGDRKHPGICVIRLDVDHFKQVNDNKEGCQITREDGKKELVSGHVLGDLVLKRIVKTVQNNLREGDFIARAGGDEFVVVIEAKEEDGFGIAEKLKKVVQDEVNKKMGFEENVGTVSIGVMAYGIESEQISGKDLDRRADAAAYAVREGGKRNGVKLWQSGMQGDPNRKEEESKLKQPPTPGEIKTALSVDKILTGARNDQVKSEAT